MVPERPPPLHRCTFKLPAPPTTVHFGRVPGPRLSAADIDDDQTEAGEEGMMTMAGEGQNGIRVGGGLAAGGRAGGRGQRFKGARVGR